MPIVRVNVAQAEHLESEYDRVANTIDNTIDDLSAMLAEANWLLEHRSNPLYGPLPSLTETATGLHNDRDDLAWRVDYLQTTDAAFLRGIGMLSGYTPNTEPSNAADIYNGISKPNPQSFTKSPEEQSLWDSFEHNIVEGNSVVGALITGRHTPQSIATIADNAGHVNDTINNAASHIRSLNPTSIEGTQLLRTDPNQFFENQLTFADGVADWTADSAKLAAALTVAGSPAYNEAWLQRTGTDVRGQIITSLQATAVAAAEDPDAFAATMIDWETLEQDPIRWAGNQAPEPVIEVLTAGAISGPLSTRRTANALAEAADVFDEVPAQVGPRQPDGLGVTRPESRLNIQLTADEIAGGHAYDKHVLEQAEFPGVTTREQFARVIENAITNYEDIAHLSKGRTAYWYEDIVVIRNPNAADGGTAFVPDAGYSYFEGLG